MYNRAMMLYLQLTLRGFKETVHNCYHLPLLYLVVSMMPPLLQFQRISQIDRINIIRVKLIIVAEFC